MKFPPAIEDRNEITKMARRVHRRKSIQNMCRVQRISLLIQNQHEGSRQYLNTHYVVEVKTAPFYKY